MQFYLLSIVIADLCGVLIAINHCILYPLWSYSFAEVQKQAHSSPVYEDK